MLAGVPFGAKPFKERASDHEGLVANAVCRCVQFVFSKQHGLRLAPEPIGLTFIGNEPLQARTAIAGPHFNLANVPWIHVLRRWQHWQKALVYYRALSQSFRVAIATVASVLWRPVGNTLAFDSVATRRHGHKALPFPNKEKRDGQ